VRGNGVTRLASVLVVGALAGCTSPELAGTGAFEGPITLPSAPRTSATKGTLTVATSMATRLDEFEPDHRGFAVFDRENRLVFSTRGYSGEGDTLRLAAGRYVVISLTGEGLTDRRMERRAVLVEAGAESLVDFEQPLAAPVFHP
jgi:hypothetical protein